jgi:tRNA-2-methylthio-N6-dimethylallyladenosine synthase
MVGKSEYLHAVHVQAADIQIGELHRVRITRTEKNSLAGVLL